MDNEELFENFNLGFSDSIKKDNKEKFLSKKRNIKNDNGDSNSKKIKIKESKQNEIINNFNSTQIKEKKEDLLLMNEIQTIKESIRIESKENDKELTDNNEEEIDFKINNIPDKEVKIITNKFEGGFHELIYPINIPEPKNIINKIENPAAKYSFKLNQFQETSILCLENHQSVLVSIHTSSGKTVVSQYAIANTLRYKNKE